GGLRGPRHRRAQPRAATSAARRGRAARCAARRTRHRAGALRSGLRRGRGRRHRGGGLPEADAAGRGRTPPRRRAGPAEPRVSRVYRVREPFATRWNDNDQYGHLNNTIYYAAMDTAVNAFMIREGGLDPLDGESVALCAASSCEFHASARFPDALEVGI